MAVVAFPTYAYNLTQPPTLVANQAALTALGGGWVLTPFASSSSTAPFDPNLSVTDIRLQQVLIENRITNQMLQIGLNIADDPVLQLRPDVLANDSGLTT